jgi:hypothetical protein
MPKDAGLKDVPHSTLMPAPESRPSGAGLKPGRDDYLTPAKHKPEAPSGSIDWRTEPADGPEQ